MIIQNTMSKDLYKIFFFIFLGLSLLLFEYIINTKYIIEYISVIIILFSILLPSLYFLFISSHPKYLLLFYLYFSFYYLIIYFIKIEYKII